MKFEPLQDSVILAINCDTKEEDLEIIGHFYNGDPIELIGFWEHKEERSYQLLSGHSLNIADMVTTLREHNQDALLSISPNGKVYLHDLSKVELNEIGVMTQVPTKEESCTYCPSTQTYWKAL